MSARLPEQNGRNGRHGKGGIVRFGARTPQTSCPGFLFVDCKAFSPWATGGLGIVLLHFWEKSERPSCLVSAFKLILICCLARFPMTVVNLTRGSHFLRVGTGGDVPCLFELIHPLQSNYSGPESSVAEGASPTAPAKVNTMEAEGAVSGRRWDCDEGKSYPARCHVYYMIHIYDLIFINISHICTEYECVCVLRA